MKYELGSPHYQVKVKHSCASPSTANTRALVCLHGQCCLTQARSSPRGSPRPGAITPPVQFRHSPGQQKHISFSATSLLLQLCPAMPDQAQPLTPGFLNHAGTSTHRSKAAGLAGIPAFPAILCNPSNSFTCSTRIMKGKSNPAPATLEHFTNSLSLANLRKSKVTRRNSSAPYRKSQVSASAT